jgi:hypothetical protein
VESPRYRVSVGTRNLSTVSEVKVRVCRNAAVRERLAEQIKAGVEERALRQYVSVLAGQTEIIGVDLNAADTPLVQ